MQDKIWDTYAGYEVESHVPDRDLRQRHICGTQLLLWKGITQDASFGVPKRNFCSGIRIRLDDIERRTTWTIPRLACVIESYSNWRILLTIEPHASPLWATMQNRCKEPSHSGRSLISWYARREKTWLISLHENQYQEMTLEAWSLLEIVEVTSTVSGSKRRLQSTHESSVGKHLSRAVRTIHALSISLSRSASICGTSAHLLFAHCSVLLCTMLAQQSPRIFTSIFSILCLVSLPKSQTYRSYLSYEISSVSLQSFAVPNADHYFLQILH